MLCAAFRWGHPALRLRAALAELPGVGEAVAAARAACEELRWHRALRRRMPECRVEATVWSAWASADLEGAGVTPDAVRAATAGIDALPGDAVGLLARGVVRAVAVAERLSAHGARELRRAPRQALAGLHLAAAGGIVAPDDLGRPRPGPQAAAARDRLEALLRLLTDPVPTLVVGAIGYAELACAEPFVSSNAVVGRALLRTVLVGGGLDPTGVAVPEIGWAGDPLAHRAALAGYADGGSGGVAAWLRHVGEAVVTGAGHGGRIADAVLAGRLPRLA
jgi:hypothetical protein